MKKLLVLLVIFISGCSTMPQPVPAPSAPPPPPGCIWIPGKGCKKIAASDSGTTVRGYHDNTQTEEEPQ